MKMLLVILLLAAPSRAQQLARGKQIYLRGESPSGKAITARVGSDDVPASMLPCGSCHGTYGRGKAEGGVKPTDLTRLTTSKEMLKRAITMGLAADGRPLNAAMPRYQMSLQDADDLIAYLGILGSEPQPGVEADALRLGLVVRDASVREALSEAAARVNRDGIYGRKLDLRFGESVESVLEPAPFAVLDATSDGTRTATVAEKDEIPTIVASGAVPNDAEHAFALLAGKDEQRRALLAFAAGREAIVLESIDAEALARAATHDKLVLVPSALGVLPPIPRALDRRVVIAFPMPPSASAPRAAALALSAIVTDTLARLGRDVTREAFVAELQRIRAFDTAITPVTWNVNRHTGAAAAFLMTVDAVNGRLLPEPGWVEAK